MEQNCTYRIDTKVIFEHRAIGQPGPLGKESKTRSLQKQKKNNYYTKKQLNQLYLSLISSIFIHKYTQIFWKPTTKFIEEEETTKERQENFRLIIN